MDFCPNRQPFAGDVDEMNEVIITNWNNVVNSHDVVYHLGDFSFAPPEESLRLLRQLNGSIILVAGNHDRPAMLKKLAPHLKEMHLTGTKKKVNKTHLFLTHYGLDVPRNMFSIHGHIHEKLYEETNKINVGVDSPLLSHLPLGEPLSEEELWSMIEERKKLIPIVSPYNT